MNAGLFAQVESIESRMAVAGLETEEVRSFVGNLQRAVQHGDATTVCGMVAFPIKTKRSGRVRTAGGCQRSDARIFNERVTKAVLSQRFEQLFVNYRGVMIGNGEVWISGVCRDRRCTNYDIRIIGVNN